MRHIQTSDGCKLSPDKEKKPQKAPKSKSEGLGTSLSDMVEFLCSPHRIGRYRQCSFENDVEYLRWFMQNH